MGDAQWGDELGEQRGAGSHVFNVHELRDGSRDLPSLECLECLEPSYLSLLRTSYLPSTYLLFTSYLHPTYLLLNSYVPPAYLLFTAYLHHTYIPCT